MVASRLPLMLEELRLAWGGPLVVTSGYRCESRNRTAGGAVKSLHLSGRAADIRAVPAEQAKLMSIARAVGFDEILPGGGKNYIHLACR
jgi:uncharacterized protein YcbK (DUF882 family)